MLCLLRLGITLNQVVTGTHEPSWDENLQLNINHSDAPIRLEIGDHTALSNTLIGKPLECCTMHRQSLSVQLQAGLSTCLPDFNLLAIGACTFTCQNLPPEEPTNMTLALDQGGEVDLELLWWPLDA